VNHSDTYGQSPVFYCVREGNITVSRQLIDLGAGPDPVDLNGQTPIYYAIKFGKFEMVEYLIQKGVNLNNVDHRSKTPSHWARQFSKTQILELLKQHGASPLTDKTKPAEKVKNQPKAQPVPRKDERKQPKKFVLTTLRENGHYEPVSEAEFEMFRQENPDLAKYFEDDGDEDNNPIDELEVAEVPEGTCIYAHWE
jgi:ankyrin repeat protein